MSLKYTVFYEGDMMVYYRHSHSHRIGAPSIMWWDGSECWCEYDECHRLDGPAKNYGFPRYHIRGKEYSKEEYYAKISSL